MGKQINLNMTKLDVTVRRIKMTVECEEKETGFSFKDNFYIDVDAFKELESVPSFINKVNECVKTCLIKSYDYKAGFIYIFYAEELGVCKLGFTRQVPSKRFEAVEAKMPVEVLLHGVYEALDPPKTEKIIHARFAELRKRGEWFIGKPEDFEPEVRRIADEVSRAFYEEHIAPLEQGEE